MYYFSTNNNSPVVDFKTATIQGQAPDGGLYFPETLPQFDKKWINSLPQLSNEEIAFEVIKPYVGTCIPDEKLFKIASEAINFKIPLVQVSPDIYSLELFHGPTLAFKDVGARFMSRCLGEFVQDVNQKVTVLVATSGDTGGAVAHGFYDVEGVEVVILYPSGKVSPVQEKQLTTLGKNISALEVAGSFDDCQEMVKQAFRDKSVTDKLFLTSANSINVARWLPQQFYYFFAIKQWMELGADYKKNPPVISVPSGNFGNICAGLLAMQTGLPIQHFIAACNENDIVSHYLKTQELQPKKSVPTLSNAMDVGNPSNFVRIVEIFNHQFPELKQRLSAFTITDLETLGIIQQVYQQYDYIMDPHGAVGYLALERYLQDKQGAKGFFLETAHPIKFPEAVEKVIQQSLDIPKSIKAMMKEEKLSKLISADYSALKNFLLS